MCGYHKHNFLALNDSVSRTLECTCGSRYRGYRC